MVKEVGNKAFFASEFAQVNSRSCTLLLAFSEHEFSYSIFQNTTNKVLYTGVSSLVFDFFNISEKQFSDILVTEAVFQYSYAKVLVIIDPFYSTLVPNVLFDASKIKEVLHFNLNLPKVDLHYTYEKLKHFDYINLYTNNALFYKAINQNFINNEIRTTESLILDFLQSKITQEAYLHVHFSSQKISCSFFNLGKLKYHNSFKYETDEDILYNILNVYNQLELNTEKLSLNVSGMLYKESSCFDLLYQYIRNIEFCYRPEKLNFSEQVEAIPAHYFMHHYIAFL